MRPYLCAGHVPRSALNRMGFLFGILAQKT